MASVPRAAAVTSRATLFMAALPANLALPDAKGARWANAGGPAGAGHAMLATRAIRWGRRAPTRIAA